MMARPRRGGDHGDPREDSRGVPYRIRAPWYFEATLKQEMNRLQYRRERLRRIFRGATRFGAPALGLLILAIVAVAGFQKEKPSVVIPPPPAQVEQTQIDKTSRKLEAPGPIREERSVSDRSTTRGAPAKQRLRSEEQTVRPEPLPATPVSLPLKQSEPPALSLPVADPVAADSSGDTDTTAAPAQPPAKRAAGSPDSTESPADTGRAGIDKSEVIEQHHPSSAPER